ncbi:hypothetical protein V8E53_001424 [Lactarius tabidus]
MRLLVLVVSYACTIFLCSAIHNLIGPYPLLAREVFPDVLRCLPCGGLTKSVPMLCIFHFSSPLARFSDLVAPVQTLSFLFSCLLSISPIPRPSASGEPHCFQANSPTWYLK